MIPKPEDLKFFFIDINDGNRKSIKELREIFLKPDMEKGHKFESDFIDYRQSFEYCLYNSLAILWDKLKEENTIDVKIKNEFFQMVYSLSRLYIKFQIRSLLNEYDKAVQTLDKPKRIMKAEEIKNLSRQLVLIQFQVSLIISPQVSFLKNKKEFYKHINNLSKGNPRENRKFNTQESIEAFVQCRNIRDKNKFQNVTDKDIHNSILKNEFKDKVLISYDAFNKFKNNPQNRAEIEYIESVINERIEKKWYQKLKKIAINKAK